MRCQPGDLAIILRAQEGFELLVGCPVTVGTTDNEITRTKGVPYWTTDKRVAGKLLAVRDDCLRPIRDPGNDAVDEMVRLKGPAPEHVHYLPHEPPHPRQGR